MLNAIIRLWLNRNPNQKKWSSYLTPDYRENFESVGEELVREDIRVYTSEEKKWAALAWLAEKKLRHWPSEHWVGILTLIMTGFLLYYAVHSFQVERVERLEAAKVQAWAVISGIDPSKGIHNTGASSAVELLNNTEVSLAHANLQGAWLLGAQLQGINLNGANLANAVLQNADLRRSDIGGAILLGTNFTGANLSGASLSKATFGPCSSDEWPCTKLQDADLSGATIIEPMGLTQDHLDAACANRKVILPSGYSQPLQKCLVEKPSKIVLPHRRFPNMRGHQR